MIKPTIADAGAIVALIDQDDDFHVWAKEQAALLPAPYLTCEAVITEAVHLLKHVSGGAKQVLFLLESGALQIDFTLSAEVSGIADLNEKYKNLPMDLADACLVRLCEMRENSIVFTIDGDFTIYRKNGKQTIPLIIPDLRRKSRNKRKN